MKRHLVAALLSVVMVAAPVMALAQTENTSSYLDTVPKKSGAHHASAHKAHGSHKGHGRAHKHKASKHHHHKATAKRAKASAAAHGATAK